MNHSNFAAEICSFTKKQSDNVRTLFFVSMRIIKALASHWGWSISWLLSFVLLVLRAFLRLLFRDATPPDRLPREIFASYPDLRWQLVQYVHLAVPT
jgi:hypothetical protein